MRHNIGHSSVKIQEKKNRTSFIGWLLECFFWRFLRSNIFEQFKLEKIIEIQKPAGKVRKKEFSPEKVLLSSGCREECWRMCGQHRHSDASSYRQILHNNTQRSDILELESRGSSYSIRHFQELGWLDGNHRAGSVTSKVRPEKSSLTFYTMDVCQTLQRQGRDLYQWSTSPIVC